MHTAALAAMGLGDEWSYEAIQVSADDFDSLVRRLGADGYSGVNVTVPHKLRALALADSASAAALAIGAANTLSFEDGAIAAENTDAVGITDSLPVAAGGRRALVLGAGGSARAAAWGLKHAGADVHVWSRTPAKAEVLARDLDVACAVETSGFAIWVNATTVGMDTANAGQYLADQGGSDLKHLPVPSDGLDAEVVVDLVYGNSDTELAEAARAAGAAVVDGFDVLARQGAASLRSWTGMEPPLDVMLRAARG